MAVTNRGRLINFVTGITGVSAGNQAIVNLPTNQRYHRIILQCTANNYTGGTALAVTKISSSAGAGATVTPTVVNGTVTAVTVVAGGTGWTVGDTFTFTDATGTGFVGTVATVTGGPPGAIATATVTVGATPSPINPATMITSIRQQVNGINMRDITATTILMIAQAQGYFPALGELPLFYTNPGRNVNNQNEVNSWDMFGQSTFSLQIAISSTVVNPGVSAIQEFDYMRNVQAGPTAGSQVPFLQPVAQHQFSWPIVAGRNDINQLPFSYPISRMYLLGSSQGNITQVEVYQDSNKVLEGTTQQIAQAYREYGFNLAYPVTGATGFPDYYNQTYATSNTLKGNLNPISVFDSAYISDPDQRYWKALRCANSMVLRVYSSVAQTLTIVQETLPGAYAA